MRTFSIYVLKEPTGEIRYFGKTCQPIQRFSQHVAAKQDWHVSRWIRSLKLNGQLPVYEVLMTGLENQDACEEEIALITWGRRKGLRLTNISDGGEGRSGFSPSAETRKNQSLLMAGNKYALGRRHTVKQNEEKSLRMAGNKNALGSKRTAEQNEEKSLRMAGNKNALGSRRSPDQNKAQSLRMATHPGKSGFPGVHWVKQWGNFRARIYVNRRPVSLGSFDTAEEAYEAVQAAKQQYSKGVPTE